MHWIYPLDIAPWDGSADDAHRIAALGKITDGATPDGWTTLWKQVGKNIASPVVETNEATADQPKRRGRPPKVK